MAVTARAQGRGVGRALLRRAIEIAEEAGARRLYLKTNHSLHPAIALYRSFGFNDAPEDRVVRSPYERADIYMERLCGS